MTERQRAEEFQAIARWARKLADRNPNDAALAAQAERAEMATVVAAAAAGLLVTAVIAQA